VAAYRNTDQVIVTTERRLLRLRSTMRFHPFAGDGVSATPTSEGCTAVIVTGTPGRKSPRTVPPDAFSPSIVNNPFF
jgi:hypothetical protein